jgi:hypothetical protein
MSLPNGGFRQEPPFASLQSAGQQRVFISVTGDISSATQKRTSAG